MALRAPTTALAWLAVLLTLETSALAPPPRRSTHHHAHAAPTGAAAPASVIHGTSVGGTRIYLADLLSSCVAASALGCAEVRRVQKERDATGHMEVEWKDPRDARSALTAADKAAQVAILGELRRQWPGLRIVGEEDEHEEDVHASALAAAAAGATSTGVARQRRDPRFCTAVANSELSARLEVIPANASARRHACRACMWRRRGGGGSSALKRERCAAQFGRPASPRLAALAASPPSPPSPPRRPPSLPPSSPTP